MEEGIFGFQDEHRFLSNFWAGFVVFEGQVYNSVEHAYQAAKTLDPHIRKWLAQLTVAQAKAAGRELEIRSDWEQIKDDVMLTCLRSKFSAPPLAKKLLATGDLYLEETNHWNDRYWGVCKDEGQNRLGKLLMQVRAELREKQAGSK